MDQSKFLAITCNSLKAREKSRVHGANGFDFTSRWWKNWRESCEPITKRSDRNHVNYFRLSFENCSKTMFSRVNPSSERRQMANNQNVSSSAAQHRTFLGYKP